MKPLAVLRRACNAASLLLLAACGRPDATAPAAAGGFEFPRAVIDFEDLPEGSATRSSISRCCMPESLTWSCPPVPTRSGAPRASC
jgi:hypothetical protein